SALCRATSSRAALMMTILASRDAATARASSAPPQSTGRSNGDGVGSPGAADGSQLGVELGHPRSTTRLPGSGLGGLARLPASSQSIPAHVEHEGIGCRPSIPEYVAASFDAAAQPPRLRPLNWTGADGELIIPPPRTPA